MIRRPLKTGLSSSAPRLEPPPNLSEAARAVFLQTVEGCHPDHFLPPDEPLLCQFSQSVVLAATAARHLEEEGAVTAEGQTSPWVGVFERASRSSGVLATKLRIAPVSRMDRYVAGTNVRRQPKGPAPWEQDDPDDGGIPRRDPRSYFSNFATIAAEKAKKAKG